MEDRIRARISQLEAERDRLVAQLSPYQQQLAAYNAAIGELRALLEPGGASVEVDDGVADRSAGAA